MKNSQRIHIFGASGSGTTTLAAALSAHIGCPHFDADQYFWIPTDPPFQQKRERTERVRMLLADMLPHSAWVLSGSICGWDEEITPMFDFAVFLWIPPEVRMSRLKKREIERYGKEVAKPLGIWAPGTAEFLAWAAQYDEAGSGMRSRLLHENWMQTLHCPVLRLEGDITVDERIGKVMKAVGSL